ncbi:PREDICTED: odorant receptor Or1-like isoform X1 [Polistes dominula]|uniref:Odorant receptor n=1 Tax=Polistes dominula TaxID=743375 RepID=A0ABM1IKF3_POLDO|nr:PREDICTED: odorant receptor Or1-like isoform X1 [Polistes dominula]
MRILTLAFKILIFCGIWKPIAWEKSTSKNIIYGIYTFLVIFFVYSFLCSQMIDMMNVDNMNDFTESSHMLLTMVIGFCKAVNVLMARDKIVKLIDILTDGTCISLDMEEFKIQKQYDRTIQTNTLYYAIMIETSVLSSILNSLLTDLQSKTLPFRSWIPYDYCSSIIVFYFTYFYQMISLTACSLFHVAIDGLFCGFLLQICCQIDILKYRLKHLNGDGFDDLRNCIRHHYQIYQIANKVNDTFALTIFAQFFISSIVLCLSMFELLKNDLLSIEFFALVLYLSTLLIQIYIFCWYGNQVKLKSSHVAIAFAESDWTSFNNHSKKLILIVMQRAAKPIEFVSAYFITVNLDTFMNLLKIT